MGAGQSLSSQHQPPSRALHVLRVTPSSPASKTTIEPFFDFVVGFEGDAAINKVDAAELEKIVESHEGRTLNLVVWSSKVQESRVVPIVPSRAWTQTNAIPQVKYPGEIKPSLLGLSMRMCEPEFSLDNVWHVLDVLEGSPAESAGLVPYGDWIIGWSGGVLSAEGDFYDVVEAHIEKPLRVYVYSYDFDTIREVVLVPNRQWGGEGLLGCVFGFGLLHRIPPPSADRELGTTPPELYENGDEFEEQQLFVPADLSPKMIDNERYNGWSQNFHPDGVYHTEEDNFTRSSVGHNGNEVHIDDHDHDHGHGHKHDHDQRHGSRMTPRPVPTSRPRVMTPTQARPGLGGRNGSGTLKNGIGLAGIRPQPYDRTSNARGRGYDDSDTDEVGSTEMVGGTEGTMSDDGDDSGSLTSVD